MPMVPPRTERERIAAEYEARDAEGNGTVVLDRVALLGLQDLELAVRAGLDAARIDLRGASVLDVGCGSGLLLHRLVELGAARGSGVDLMPARVAVAHERYPQLDVVAGDATALAQPDGAFDLVSHFTCLSSVLDDATRAAIAAEMWRVLRPGGAILHYDLRPGPAWLEALGRAVRRRSATVWTPVTTIGPGELARLFPVPAAVLTATTVNAALPAVLRRGRLRRALLERVPLLRSHTLAVIVKPG